jgi:hypothetical protein
MLSKIGFKMSFMQNDKSMTVTEFREHLLAAPDHELCFVLPDGGRIAAHAHITEVGRTDRRFLDCGGMLRQVAACTLQAWVADDVEHRLAPGSLAAILAKAAPVLGTDDLAVEIEYEDGFLSQFPVLESAVSGRELQFRLGVKHTDCLAKELCLPSAPAAADSRCCAGGGCC